MNIRFSDRVNGNYWNGSNNSTAVADRTESRGDSLPMEEPIAVLVDAATFSELLICKRDLQRSDSPNSNQLGLYDSRSGVRYVISESDLFQADLFQADLFRAAM